MKLVMLIAACACGGGSGVGVDGEWSGGFYDVRGAPLSCAGHDFTGAFRLEQGEAATLTGDWTLCDEGLHGTLTGSMHPDGALDFTLDREGVAVIGRLGVDGTLNGEVVGLSTQDARFHAARVH